MTSNRPEAQREAALAQMVMATQAVIHFAPDSEIIFANDNFVAALGYDRVEDIVGRNHELFVDRAYAASAEYAEFWSTLRAGHDHAGVFKRIRRDGAAIYIRATYAPVLDAEGRVERVIKVATDITDRQLTQQLLEDGLDALRAGNLTPATFDTSYEEVRKMGTDFNSMVASLSDFVRAVHGASARVQSISGDLDSASDDLARRGESQAASLEQVAAAITELSASAESSAQRAKESYALTKASQDRAEEGRKVVDAVTKAMNEIESASSQIGKILTSIDEIAFQTNLLALNAGVEAVRAGEAGRGFAVVASEVRSLAQRSSESATEIKNLVRLSHDKVKNGAQLVSQADEVLRNIFQQISTISDNVQSNMQTLDEQSLTISEINTATTQLSHDTEHNASSIRASADMSKRLKIEADGLLQQVQRYRVEPQQVAASITPFRQAS
ncbi:methyl-accepting chemotaxis protein [Pseudooceanicola sp. LIPI14-2-Ac024]|uniref:methyl-accepting chemotaxis protein n=1 Tax=Pseudooceanicola sp. LIPI14-2-Ac024 TaxID=3344875 RepID=UPI0035D013B7